ncbi:uncharacterized protein DS421_18g613660 [Arachis hypogaea]|nr:uncharacterized protein DS421_18g613660 [Arachis hypogaea]
MGGGERSARKGGPRPVQPPRTVAARVTGAILVRSATSEASGRAFAAGERRCCPETATEA